MPDKKLILIHPPFCMPDKPYISTAVLYGHLSEKGVDVSVLDLNIDFYRYHLAQDNIDNAMVFIDKRFHELDSRIALNSLEIQEYQKLVQLKQRLTGQAPPFHLLFKNSHLSNVEQFRLFGLGLDIVNALHFPESLDFIVTTGYIRYTCRGNRFSSQDIIQSIKKPSLYASTLKKIMIKYLGDNHPEIIGISVSFPDQIMPAFFVASLIKEIRPDSHICFGGTFVSSHMRDMDNIHLFDYVDSFILDEGESPLLELVKCLSESRSYEHIPGLIFARDNKIIKNPAPGNPQPNHGLPLPDYGCVDLDRYLVNSHSMALLFRLSQGCYWHRCSFCRTELSFVKHHVCAQFGHITSWIQKLVDHSPVKVLHFTDDAADPERLGDLSAFLLEQKLPLFWVTNMRFDKRISREHLSLYKKAGCRAIYFGLESCHERVLKKMKKGISIPWVEHILTNCSDIGIPVHLYMIVGFPTETEHEALESFSRVYEWKKQGLASQVIYNVFEISGWSDIALNPLDYGITGIVPSPSRDLSPPVSDFTGKGMLREKAKSLCLDFITRLNDMGTYTKKDMMDLFISDTPQNSAHGIQTRYDVRTIQTTVTQLYKNHPSKDIQFKAVPGVTVLSRTHP
ncbi:MAG: B12-binding domain-containing radical SAM protein [Proteobacteria bacterium]|nr:B12-binding domain-containing radical SAM protein [Pseudomonadota bacterium]